MVHHFFLLKKDVEINNNVNNEKKTMANFLSLTNDCLAKREQYAIATDHKRKIKKGSKRICLNLPIMSNER